MRAFFETWKREPVLASLAAFAVLLLAAYPVYLSARVYIPVWTGAQPELADFSFYYDGAQRFLDDPLALYPSPYFGYMYPPPSVVLFLPLLLLPLAQSLMVSVIGIVVLAVACLVLTLDIYERWRGEALPKAVRVMLILIGLATAPVFQNLKYAQVNVLVLFIGLAFLELVRRDKLFAAALVLSVGFWLKLYPIALALLGLKRGRLTPLAAGFAVGLVALPVVLLPLVPLELYRQYFFDLLPYWATATNMDALVQSIPGVLAHLGQQITDYLRSHDLILSPTIRLINTTATLGFVGGLYAAYFTGRLQRDMTGVLLLAVLPIISILGWEHTYVLAVPLYIVLLLEARHRSRGVQLLAALATLVFMFPKLPQPQMVWTFEHWPRPVVDVFYARFLLVTLVLLPVVVVWLWRRRTKNASAAGAAEAS